MYLKYYEYNIIYKLGRNLKCTFILFTSRSYFNCYSIPELNWIFKELYWQPFILFYVFLQENMWKNSAEGIGRLCAASVRKVPSPANTASSTDVRDASCANKVRPKAPFKTLPRTDVTKCTLTRSCTLRMHVLHAHLWFEFSPVHRLYPEMHTDDKRGVFLSARFPVLQQPGGHAQRGRDTQAQSHTDR